MRKRFAQAYRYMAFHSNYTMICVNFFSYVLVLLTQNVVVNPYYTSCSHKIEANVVSLLLNNSILVLR